MSQILNVITTTVDQVLILNLELGNVLQNPIPGAWATQGPATWNSDNSYIKLEPLYNGLNCKVTCLSSGSVISVVTVNANVDILDGTGYHPLSGSTQVKFDPTTKVTGLLALPSTGDFVLSKTTLT